MYKVFIENREVNFINNKDFFCDGLLLKLESNSSLLYDLVPKIKQFDEFQILNILVDLDTIDLRSLFKDFIFIEAAGGIVQDKNEFLFIKRNGFWDIPKGKLDIGESFEIAAEREIQEECGLSYLSLNEFICSTFHTYFFKNQWYLKETKWYHFELDGKRETKCQVEEGITETKWVNHDNFSFIENQTFNSIKYVVKSFENLMNTNDKLREAIDLLNLNRVVAIPTETVYGLAANALSESAVDQIFNLKNRPQTNPLIVHCGSVHQVEKLVSDFPDSARKLAETFWPGPLTLLLPKNSQIPHKITAGSARVGVRIPNHPLTLKLLNKLDYPLAAPSANKYGSTSPTCAEHVQIQFKNEVPLVLDGGPCQVGIESTIVGFEDDNIIVYRLGQITPEEIEAVCGQDVYVQNEAGEIIVAPGMVKHHYAPKTLLKIVYENSQIEKSNKSGVILFNEKMLNDIPLENQVLLAENDNLLEASRNLYRAFYQLDYLNLEVIFIKPFPNVGIGISLNDRIRRAGMKA
jgi:L-threonylcarbamoyladenylate synthase